MPWNPHTYHQFKSIRNQPFYDLMALLSEEGLTTAVDLGCGTGEQTSILADRFDNTTFLGLDASEEMLQESQAWVHDRLQFRQASIEAFASDTTNWDLIFSNAALQWTDDHEVLFPQLISKLHTDGQFAVQMPVQSDNVLNQLLLELVQESPFADYLNHWKRTSPVLEMDAYAQLLYDNGLSELQIIKKVYPIIAENPDTLFDFISGSALIPYMERLSESEQKLFIAEYKKRIEKTFKTFPAIYPFKRLLLYGKKVVFSG